MDAREACCPGCGKPADDVSGVGGWRFCCHACVWRWGHPQDMSYQQALDLRAMARAEADRARSDRGHT